MKNIINFFPCYTNIDKVKPLVAFGWNAIFNTNLGALDKENFSKYLMSKKELTDLFTEDKIRDLVGEYFKYAGFIKYFHMWAEWYLNPINKPKPALIGDDQYFIEEWNKNIFMIYEMYRISQSIFKRILYDQILTDLLWNSKFDPRNPTLQHINSKKVEEIISYNNNIKNILIEATHVSQNVIEQIETHVTREWICPYCKSIIGEKGLFYKDGQWYHRPCIDSGSIILPDRTKSGSLQESTQTIMLEASIFNKKYNINIDEDGNILIKKNFEADLQRYYTNTLRLMKLYKNREKIEELKAELAKLFFINELIEVKYIYNKDLTNKEKEEYKSYQDLRANILSSFKLYLNYILSIENNFNFNEYYENSKYNEVVNIKHEQIRGLRKLLKTLLIGN